MTVVLAFPQSSFFRLFAEKGRHDSYYMDLAAKFVHFIIIQVLAIILALIGKSYCWLPVSGFGFLVLTYAVTSVAMTALALFGVAQLSNQAASIDHNPKDPP
jgi:hypothetical protein